MRLIAENGITDVIIVRNLCVVKNDAVFQFGRISDNGTAPDNGTAANKSTMSDFCTVTDDKRAVQISGRRDLSCFADLDVLFGLRVFIRRKRSTQL